MSRFLSERLEDFAPYVAGMSVRDIRERYGLKNVVKMASNENPLGVSPLVQKAIKAHADTVFRYARPGNPRLTAALADFLGIPSEHIVPGNGSDEIIDLLVRVCAEPGENNIIAFSPCFSMYPLTARLCGVEFRQTPLSEDFTQPLDALLELADEKTALCFVTTPDNPSGWSPRAEKLAELAAKLPQRCLLVLDEAYMDFVAVPERYSLLSRFAEFENVAVLRTFSKLYGLAGLRLGYGVLPLEVADACKRVKPPFSVNVLAQEGGLAALRDDDFREAVLDVVHHGRDFLSAALEDMGCKVYPSLANFLMFELPADCKHDAEAVFEAMLQRGVIIRPLKSYGLPGGFRVSIGNDAENKLFAEVLSGVLSS